MAEDYLVKRRRRERAEEESEASSRRPNVVAELLAAGALEPGIELKLRTESFAEAYRGAIEVGVEGDPDAGVAEWTGHSLNKSLRWRKDGRMYSATGLVLRILNEYGYEVTSVPGPQYWVVPDGRTLLEVADSLPRAEGRQTAGKNTVG